MVVSILVRKTVARTEEEWRQRLERGLPRIMEVLQRQPGFVSAQFGWGSEGDGRVVGITGWQTPEDARRYIRGGAAALVATIEDAVLPTAPYPDGTWVRHTFALHQGGVDATA